jgi:Pyruvate/2-oxoacid:ferredoxin oxidoreductase delta subunit
MAKPNVDTSLCVGCGGCNSFCPYGILDLGDGQAVVVQDLLDRCDGCKLCEDCPEGAITVA